MESGALLQHAACFHVINFWSCTGIVLCCVFSPFVPLFCREKLAGVEADKMLLAVGIITASVFIIDQGQVEKVSPTPLPSHLHMQLNQSQFKLLLGGNPYQCYPPFCLAVFRTVFCQTRQIIPWELTILCSLWHIIGITYPSTCKSLKI